MSGQFASSNKAVKVLACLFGLALLLSARSAQREDVCFGGRVYTMVESGYLSSSGTLVDTRPSIEQQVDGNVYLGDYGRLTACGWVISALHDRNDGVHRMPFYLFEATTGYGYDFTFSDSLDLVNEAGIVWDSPWGYRHYESEEVGWWFRQSVENPYLVPYTEAIGLFTPDVWLRVALGVRRACKLTDRLTLTPALETVWGDSDRFGVCYGEAPSRKFLGGAFMTLTPGLRLDWNVCGSWNVWLRAREFLTIDRQARDYVRTRTEYFAKNETAIFTLGVSYGF